MHAEASMHAEATGRPIDPSHPCHTRVQAAKLVVTEAERQQLEQLQNEEALPADAKSVYMSQ